MVTKEAKPIVLKAGTDARVHFLLIHGYTGAPSDFGDFISFLHRHLGADVTVPLLRGHGTRVEDLDGLRYADFFEQMELELKRIVARGQTVVVGGYSFGAYLALHLAARYPVAGVFSIAIPYHLAYPFGIPGLYYALCWQPYWKKRLSEQERRARAGSFYYSSMPVYSLKLMARANHILFRELPALRAPLLAMHSTHDRLGRVSGTEAVYQRAGSSSKELVIFNDSEHNVFYTPQIRFIEQKVADFFQPHLS